MKTVTVREDLAQLGEMTLNVPVAKLLYSASLLVLTGALVYVAVGILREVSRIWFDDQTYLVDFTFDDGGDVQPARGQALTKRFRSYLSYLDELFAKSSGIPRLPEGAQVYIVDEGVGFASEQSSLENLQLNWQGIDFGGIIDQLRKWAWRPETLGATVSISQLGADATLLWTNSPRVPEGITGGADGFFHVRGRPDGERAVFDLACKVFWLNAAHRNKRFQAVEPDAFCEWGWLDIQYRNFARRARRTASGLSEDDVNALTVLRSYASRLIELDTDFALPYRLRADVIGLLPDSRKSATDRELVVADTQAFGRLTSAASGGVPPAAGSTVPAVGVLPAEVQVALNAVRASEIAAEISIAAIPAKTSAATVVQPPPIFPNPSDLDALQRAGTLAPGLPLVATGSTWPFITAGPIVVNAAGERFLVLPGYAVDALAAQGGDGKATALGLKLVTGEPIGEIATGPNEQRQPIVLVRLAQGVRFTNRILPSGDGIPGIAAPESGARLALLHSSFFVDSAAAQEAEVARISIRLPDQPGVSFFEARPAITAPGLGGAPIVNANGALIGIAYASDGISDQYLNLAPLLEARGVSVAQQ